MVNFIYHSNDNFVIRGARRFLYPHAKLLTLLINVFNANVTKLAHKFDNHPHSAFVLYILYRFQITHVNQLVD